MGGLVNFFFGNHDGGGVEALRDHAVALQDALERLGHRVRMTVELPDPAALNILWAPFPDRRMWRLTRALRGLDYGIVVPQAFDGRRFLGEDSRPEHVANFRRLAEAARFVWALDADSVAHLAAAAGTATLRHLPLGYSPALREAPPFDDREIMWDAALLARPTPYREEILERLRAAGLQVYSERGFPAPHIRRTNLPRARLLLALRRSRDWPSLNPVQTAFMLSNDYCVVSEACPQEDSLASYTTVAESDAILERCQALLAGDRWRSVGRANGERFRTEMPMDRLLAPLVEVSFGKEWGRSAGARPLAAGTAV